MSQELTDEEIKAAGDRGIALFFDAVVPLLESDKDPADVAYSLFVALARYLAQAGWTAEELMRDVAHHAHHQTSEGQA